jgi:hypothetical protein
MKIGISFSLRSPDAGIWENGANQNIFFLHQLLKATPGVERVYLLNFSDFETPPGGIGWAETSADIVRLASVRDELAVLIEAGRQLHRDDIDYLRSKNTRIVGYRMASDALLERERMLYGLENWGYSPDRLVKYDEIWTHQHHMKTSQDYWRLCLHAPVYVLPHIWSTFFKEAAEADIYRAESLEFSYVPGRNKGKIAVFEPNINMVKTCITPTLIAEQAYRDRPDLVCKLHVTNGQKIDKTQTWIHFVNALSLFHAGNITTEPRFNTFYVMAKWASVVITHQWENALNYLYYDVLSGNYPLIHNSPLIKEYGYYYEEFDSQAGAKQLIKALTEHDQNLEWHAQNNKKLLAEVDSLNPANIDAHAVRLQALLANPARQ